uniref:PKD_channel domain-containing protein n=1 Tax=Rhodnius prolixus TaxID=13249 RepID=T1IDF8_RHOPR
MKTDVRFCTWAISRSLTDPKRFMKVSLRELLVYCLFLFIFTWDSLQTKIFYFRVVSTRWSWQNTKDEVSYSGKVSTYSPDGYFVDLTKRYYVENKTLHELRSSGWINRATRALLLEFVTYSPNTNLFAVIKMVMELPPGGGVIPTADCYSMQLISTVAILFIAIGKSLFVAVVVYGFERAEEKRILTAPKRKYGFYEYFLNIGAAIFYKIKCSKVSKKIEQKERSIELKKDHELIVSMLASLHNKLEEIQEQAKHLSSKGNIDRKKTE